LKKINLRDVYWIPQAWEVDQAQPWRKLHGKKEKQVGDKLTEKMVEENCKFLFLSQNLYKTLNL
jgi:hypothetical protein